jgi:hypothetical protein
MPRFRALRPFLAACSAALLSVLVVAPAFAHEERDINGYAVEVGFITEPVFVGDRNGLFVEVRKDDQPVDDVQKTVKATVAYGSQTRDLALNAGNEPGTYTAIFIPTAAGRYTFHLTGTLPDGSVVDQSFTSSPTGFDEVQEIAAGQFPVQFPSQAQLVANAQKGADAAGQTPIALALGATGVLLGLAALGVAVAGRSRAR